MRCYDCGGQLETFYLTRRSIELCEPCGRRYNPNGYVYHKDKPHTYEIQVTCGGCNYKFDLYREGSIYRDEHGIASFLCSTCEVK